MRRRAFVPGAAALAAALAADAQAAPAAHPTLRLEAEFLHPLSSGEYRTRLGGVLEPAFRRLANGSVTLEFAVEPVGCRVGAWWERGGGILPPPPSDESTSPPSTPPPPAAATRPAELCLARAEIGDAELAAWLAGTGAVDPRLRVHLLPLGTAEPDAWATPTGLEAALFLRGCVGTAYRRLGTLRVAPGALRLRETPDAQGVPRLELAAASAELETSGEVWAEVLAGCGGLEAGLPETPAPGTSSTFTAAMRAPDPDPGSPSAQLARLFRELDALAASQGRPRAAERRLLARVARISRRLRGGDSAAALRELARFDVAVVGLVQRGLLPPSAGQSLLAGSALLRTSIGLLAATPTAPPPDPELFCEPAPAACPDEPCALTPYHVDPSDDARRGCGLAPPGSEICAFRSLGEALAQAAEDGRCGAELHAAAGEYAEDVELTRHLHILGSALGRTRIRGTLSSSGPYELVVEHATLAPPEGRGVSVNDPCARTALLDVVVIGAEEYGMRQRGGSFDARGGAVSFTRSTPDFLTRGTGILLSCGVQGSLDDLNLLGNASGGLLVLGEGTAVDARDLLVTGTGVHPEVAEDPNAAPAAYGAVQVHAGARLSGSFLRILDNALTGILVTGAGSSARLRDVDVSRTALVLGNQRFGINVQVLDGAALDMTDFLCSEAALAGLQVASGGEADLHGTCLRERVELDEAGDVVDWECLEPTALVQANPIGVNVQTEGFDLGRIQDGVFYRDNALNLDATGLPVPGPVGGLEE